MESHHKITKPRSKMVKPILKKLSHSEKNSLDLDRGWDEQAGGYGWAGSGGGGGGLYESAGAGRSVKDVSFIFGEPSAPMVSSSVTGSGAGGAAARPRFQHGRSPSGTSHVSVATNGSGGPPRAGSFVHPFQQTPRTSTPPLMSYANSMASFDCGPRDYSPTITEDDDGTGGCGGGGDEDDVSVPPSLSTQVHHHHHHHRTHSSSLSQSNLRRPSLASQRTSSFSDVSGAKPLRINTKPATARRGPGKLSSSLSHSDLHLNLTLDSPISSTLNANSAFPPSTSSQAPSIISPISLSASVAPMSPLRSSLDGFRLRSRSEVDTWDRAETIREARRRFEERERAKDEKREREASKKQERREQREAKVLEKAHAAQLRKNSRSSTDVPGLAGLAPRRPGPAAVATGSSKSSSRRGSSAAAAKKLSSDLAAHSSTDEKRGAEFLSSNYDSVEGGRTPRLGGGVDDVRFQPAGPRRGAAKRRTQGYWTGFILWLRTRLFRLGKA